MIAVFCTTLLLASSLDTLQTEEPAVALASLSGLEVMQEVSQRHELYPYIYEEQTMVMVDRHGYRNTRKLRRFSRVESDSSARLLLVFDYPPEVRGVALLARRDGQGRVSKGVYLPAMSNVMKEISSRGDGRFLGSDFTVRDLAVENIDDYRYRRLQDLVIDGLPHFLVEALPASLQVERETGYSRRLHLVRQDNYYITRTDYFDRRGRFAKRRTAHELKQVDGQMWRANMILMQDHKESHYSLIKINRRVFSQDYVPREIFEPAWIFANRHVLDSDQNLFRDSHEEGQSKLDPVVPENDPDSAAKHGKFH